MSLGLVSRSARALSDHLNATYRVLKGVDPDSLLLRLNPGGSFEVRHSATNAPVFSVTDAGTSVTIGPEDLAPGAVTNTKLGPNAVTTDKIANATILPADLAPGGALRVLSTDATGTTVAWTQVPPGAIASDAVGPTTIVDGAVSSAKILDGTILDVDISASANINGAKLLDASVPASKLSGSSVGPGSITTTEIANGTIADVDINSAAAIGLSKLAHVGANNLLKSNGTANVGGQLVNADVAAAAAVAYSKLNLAASIASGDLVLGAGIQATTVQGGNTDPQTASGTPVDLQNMTRTLTTLAGSLALITFDGVFSSTAAAPYLIVDLMQDGVVAVRRQFQLPASIAQIVAYSYLTTVALTAAAHTWKIQWWVAGGTMTVTALGILRGLTVVELKRPTLV